VKVPVADRSGSAPREHERVAAPHRFGAYEIDLDRFEVRDGGQRVPVEPQVFDVLAFLVRHRDRVVTKEELLDAVWGDRFVSESALTSRIKAVRRAVGDTGRDQRVIRTVHGRGYQFVAELEPAAEPAPAEPAGTPSPPTVRAVPRTRYARSEGLSIAYQVFGDGDEDLVFIPGFVSNLELHWEHPSFAHYFTRLATMGRLLTFDKRGTGLSERVPPDRIPTLEERIDDVRVVMDDAGIERASLFGISEGSAMALLFAASHPDRVSRLVLFGSYGASAPGRSTITDDMIEEVREHWGTGGVFEYLAPSTRGDKATRRFFSRLERHSATPDVAAGLLIRTNEIDVRPVLASIRVPTTIIHRTGDTLAPVAEARRLAGAIPGARFVEIPGNDHLAFIEPDDLLDEVALAVGGPAEPLTADRILTTVLFVDVVDSTQTAADIGDERWRDLLEQFHHRVAVSIQDERGQVVNRAGDGALANFDGPARAVRAGRAIINAVAPLGLQIRAGVHTAEVERIGTDLAGIGVHIGARVAATAEPGEVWATRTVRDLVAGSGLEFAERGIHQLKGVPEAWSLYAAG
jgi:pimeloyl-ACP methyl ester carboxylesterase/DNA-binding winged helix-turn-helix (wHTH) protein